jgi:2-polyprenyl-3-methyl-5-hydroxy-6-metoxy-1,4-benzoquinol methylase
MNAVPTYRCVPSRYGWSASPMPRTEDIDAYYREKYYQQPGGQYRRAYEPEELTYFEDRAKLVLAFAENAGVTSGRVLDIGCGEGFFLKHAAAAGFEVWGVDHSLFGLDQHNPTLADRGHFREMNVLEADDYFGGVRFELVVCKNVLEHVLDPDILMVKLSSQLSQGGVGIVEVPNDYSLLHNRVLKGRPREGFPIFCPPVHLHYFNTLTIQQLIERAGLRVIDGFSDYPIDHLLLEDQFNYYEIKEVGRHAHSLRRRFMNLLNDAPKEARLGLFRAMFGADLGRDISVVFRR